MRVWNRSRPPTAPFTLNRDSWRAQGLVAWYPLGALDASYFVFDRAGRYDMNLGGSTKVLGQLGEPVLKFNGTTDYVSRVGAVLTAAPMAYSCWFAPLASGAAMTLMSISETASADNTIDMTLSSGLALLAEAKSTSSTAATTTTAAVLLGKWYHAYAGYESTSRRNAYLNGGGKGTDSSFVNPNPTSSPVTTLGALRRSSFLFPFNGYLGECSIYNITHSDADVAALADVGTRFELFYPLRSRKWMVLPAAAGGGFKAAWVANRSRIIGAGMR